MKQYTCMYKELMGRSRRHKKEMSLGRRIRDLSGRHFTNSPVVQYFKNYVNILIITLNIKDKLLRSQKTAFPWRTY